MPAPRGRGSGESWRSFSEGLLLLIRTCILFTRQGWGRGMSTGRSSQGTGVTGRDTHQRGPPRPVGGAALEMRNPDRGPGKAVRPRLGNPEANTSLGHFNPGKTDSLMTRCLGHPFCSLANLPEPLLPQAPATGTGPGTWVPSCQQPRSPPPPPLLPARPVGCRS